MLPEPPPTAIGKKLADGLCDPFTDPQLHDTERGAVFASWVSAYHSHPYYKADGSMLERKPTNLTERELKGAEKFRPTTLETFTAEDFARNLDVEAGIRSDAPLDKLPPDVLFELVRGAYLLRHPVYGVNALPGSRIHFIYGKAAPWTVHWSHWAIEEYFAGWERDGLGVRIGKIKLLEGVNHFVSCFQSEALEALTIGCLQLHWDDPDRLLTLCKEEFDVDSHLFQSKL